MHVLIALILAIMSISDAFAADFTVTKTEDETGTIVQLSGMIAEGDTERLAVALGKAAVAGEKVAGIWLNSPGGNINEGIKLSRVIHDVGLITVVAHDKVCASACFLLFVAGSSKFVSRSAHVGVHSAINTASMSEDVNAMAATVVMARAATLYGVPAGITASMVNTPPAAITWLSENELSEMGVLMSGPSQPTTSNVVPVQTRQPTLQILGATPSPSGYTSLIGILVRSQCHMNECYFFSIDSAQSVSQTDIEQLVDLDIKSWIADYKDGDYTKRSPRRFNGEKHSYVICSRSRPQVIDGDDKDGWMQTSVAPGAADKIFGYLESSLSVYWAACHGQKVEDVFSATEMAKRLGYAAIVSEGAITQTKVDRPSPQWFAGRPVRAAAPTLPNDDD